METLSAPKVLQEILSKQTQNQAKEAPNLGVNDQDMKRFQDAMNADLKEIDRVEQTNNKNVQAVEKNNMGDKILNNISSLRDDYNNAINKVKGLLSQEGGISSQDLIKIQMDLVMLSLKQETIGKITQKSSQNVDVLLKS